jgi:hypothetical protein
MALVDVVRSNLHVGIHCVRGYGVNLQVRFCPTIEHFELKSDDKVSQLKSMNKYVTVFLLVFTKKLAT